MARRQSLRGQLYRAAVTWGTSRPMYHLTTRSDRIKSLREASRVVRPDGIVAVAAISRFASLCDGPGPGILLRPRFRKIVERDLAEGQHWHPEYVPRWFTTAYFHEPQQLQTEIEDAGMQCENSSGPKVLLAA